MIPRNPFRTGNRRPRPPVRRVIRRPPHGQNGVNGAGKGQSARFEQKEAWNLNNDCWIELLTTCGHPPPYYRVRDGAGPAGIEIYCLACAQNLKTSIEMSSPQRSDR